VISAKLNAVFVRLTSITGHGCSAQLLQNVHIHKSGSHAFMFISLVKTQPNACGKFSDT